MRLTRLIVRIEEAGDVLRRAAGLSAAKRHENHLVAVKRISACHGPHLNIPVFDKSARADGTFSREDFAYNQEADVYFCPPARS